MNVWSRLWAWVGSYIPVNHFEINLRVRAELEQQLRAQIAEEVAPYLQQVDDYLAQIEQIVTVLGERVDRVEHPEWPVPPIEPGGE